MQEQALVLVLVLVLVKQQLVQEPQLVQLQQQEHR
jgi:hypothetical protein